jgi:hypothetical protein
VADGLSVSPQDRDLMIRTIIGEAGGQDLEGMAGVANVITNRLSSGKYGKSGADVVLAPNQFEPWSNRGAELLGYDPSSDAYKNAGAVLDGILAGNVKDNTGGATHFYAPKLQSQLGRSTPAWAQGQGKLIAGQLYYAPQGAVSRAPAAPATQAIADVTEKRTNRVVPIQKYDALKAFGVDDEGDPVSAAPTPPAAAPAPVRGPAAPPVRSFDALKAFGVDDEASPASPGAQPAGKPLLTDPATGYSVSRNDQGYVSLTDPKSGRIVQQFAPGDYEARASQLGSFVGGGVADIPIAGPAIAGGIQRAAAATRAVANDTPFSQELAGVQSDVARDAAVYPKTNVAGGLVGAGAAYAAASRIPVVGPLLAGGPGGMLSKMAISGGVNALIGGTDAYARGGSPTMGALFGGAGGALSPPVGHLVGNAVATAGNKLAGIMPTGIQGLSRPAANFLTEHVVNPDGPASMDAALDNLGPLATLADAGPSAQLLASGLASRPGPRSVIDAVLSPRHAGRDNRLLSDVDSTLGPAESPQAVTDAILNHRRVTDAANYSVVHAQNAPVDVSNVVSSIDNMLPTSVGGTRTALNSLRKELIAEPATYDEFGQQITPETYHDNSELLHNLRKEIDQTIDYGKPGLGVPEGALQGHQGAVRTVRGALDDALKKQVPGMTEADAASSALAKRAEAVESGTKVLDGGKSASRPADFDAERAVMAPGVAIAQNKGIRGEVDRLVGTKRNDLVALQNALQGEGGWNTAKLATAFGDDNANALVNSINRERTFSDTHNEVLRGSQTGKRNAVNQSLNETDPVRPNIIGATPTGLALQAGKSFVVNPLLDLLLSQDSAARNTELANALVAQGPAAKALLAQLAVRAGRQGTISAGAKNAGNVSSSALNLLLRAGGVGARSLIGP